jgi:hypothetical protein
MSRSVPKATELLRRHKMSRCARIGREQLQQIQEAYFKIGCGIVAP